MPALAIPFVKLAGHSSSTHPRRHSPHFWPHLSLILLITTKSLFGTPLGPPPRARQFLDKRSSGARTTVADMIRANPLLASLAMFRDDKSESKQLMLQEPVDITSNSIADSALQKQQQQHFPITPTSMANRNRIGRRKGNKEMGDSIFLSHTSPPIDMFFLANSSSRQHSAASRMDNFEPLHQIFNATLFNMAIPMGMERTKGGIGGKGIGGGTNSNQQPLWRWTLPWAMAAEKKQKQQQKMQNETEMMPTMGMEKKPAAEERIGWEKLGSDGRLIEKEGIEGEMIDGNEAKLNGNELIEEEKETAKLTASSNGPESAEPFKVTDSLRLALSTAPPVIPTTTMGGERQTETLVGQEEFPMRELEAGGKAWKYPWERQRGENQSTTTMRLLTSSTTIYSFQSTSPAFTSSPSPLMPFPPVMPGASFYVDQHVSHGLYGREPETASDIVYDPNVLQSRYGYTGMLELPKMSADGQLVRFRNGGVDNSHNSGRLQKFGRTAHFGVAQQQLGPIQLPLSSSPISLIPAAAVFFIPAPPRLSMAHAIPVAPNRLHGQTISTRNAKKQQLGFWPTTSPKWAVDEGDDDFYRNSSEATTTPKLGGKLTPMGGNHLRWVPLEKAEVLAKLVPFRPYPPKSSEFETFEEFGDATKFPCIADPPEMVIRDSPPDLGPALAGCFRRVRQCVLHMLRPLERRVGLALSECVRLCVGQKQCKSLVFARPNSICDIFAVRNGSLGTAGRLLYHRDFDYLEPRKLQMNLSECWQAMTPGDAPRTGKLILVDSGDQTDLFDQPNNSSSTMEPSNSSQSPSRDSPRDICTAERDIVVFKSQGYRLADRSRKQRAAVGEPPPPTKATTTMRTAVAIEAAIIENDGGKMFEQQSTETECIFSCLVNLGRGKTPFECLAATFDQVQSSCLLYGPGSAADGSVHLLPDPAFAHYEKGCIHADLVEQCQGLPIVRYPQKTLLGFALGSRRAGSLIECLELCWTHIAEMANLTTRRAEGNEAQKCRSVVFFYEESSGHNCMLNSESRDTAPAFFVDENEALVDYASFDGCFQEEEGGDEEEAQKTEEEEDDEKRQLGSELEEALAVGTTAKGGGGGGGEGEGSSTVAMLGQNKKNEPKLLELQPLAERRRNPPITITKEGNNQRIYFTKNSGQTTFGGENENKGIEKRLARLVDSEKDNSSRKLAKNGQRLMRRHRGSAGVREAADGKEKKERRSKWMGVFERHHWQFRKMPKGI